MVRLFIIFFYIFFFGLSVVNAKKDKLPLPNMYVGSVLRVIDGDTIEVRVKLWPTITADIPVRVSGINVPERHDKCREAKTMSENAKSFVEQKLPRGTRIRLYGVKKGKWGSRIIAWIEYKPNKNWMKLTNQMLKKRLACPYDGGTRRDWCNPTFNPCWK